MLQHEQRTHHQDQAIKPGGLQAFVVRWADETSELLKQAGQDIKPVYQFAEYLESYRQQDPVQRAINLRAALAILDELDGHERALEQPSKTTEQPRAQPRPRTPDVASAATLPAPPRREPAAAQVAPQSKEAKAAPTPKPPREAVHLDAGMSASHAALALLQADITAVPGVGPTVAAKLHGLGIRNVRDLLFYFPREHRDYSKLTKIAHIPFNEVTTTMGLIWESKNVVGNGKRTRTSASISDDSGKISVTWFNQPFLLKQLKAQQGAYLVVTGVKQRFGNKVEFTVRSHEFPEQGDLLSTGRLVPVYPLTEGLSAKSLRRFAKWVVDRYAAMLPDPLPFWVRSEGRLVVLPEAVAQIHYPESETALESARRRLGFDELFLIQLGMQERRSRWQYEAPRGNAFAIDLARVFIDPPAQDKPPADVAEQAPQDAQDDLPGATLWSPITSDQPFEAMLPFRFTPAQRRVIQEISGDLAKDQPMSRLLQGDVGAGKTAVAAAVLLIAALNGYQGAIMAPTELLAEQHARSISAMLEPFGIRTVLLTGSLRSRERALGRAAIEQGTAMVAIGTHALIQEDVNFQRLGLVVVDEQHRFGVEQRDALRQKGYHPHMLVMTATPIPRTLALTLYGDLDVSVIDQMPPGRQTIISRWRTGNRRDEAYTLIAREVAEGHQAFIIFPLIDESESLAVKAATVEYERLSREVFPDLRLGLLHGGMKSADKDDTMRRFRDHALDILVATSVIEVGIDIPNATVMVIEDADRFGLSQLHQFRGRVGRGNDQSYCYVLSADAGPQAAERLDIFQNTLDGFKLSDADLKLRGPGDFMGVRQSGMPELRVASLSDTPLIELSRSLAEKLWQRDPYLRQPEHAALRERMHLFWSDVALH
ncbi:MAG TPA: ATP-dependent DNA helicase RecG [Ktedonobacteraceae bacterium]|nr:ATP-dependent DNA helicase RecG [Ktedonobacteraceae bacterium]